MSNKVKRPLRGTPLAGILHDEKILILGGTADARKLATQMIEQGHKVVMSIAGRTKDGESREKQVNPKVEVRVGGFGGAKALGEWIMENKVGLLVDATHPFARQISENAQVAAEIAGVKLECHVRKPWGKEKKDKWLEVTDLENAMDVLPENARAFLALGHQHIAVFESRSDVHFIIRQVDSPEKIFGGRHEYVIGQPSKSVEDEVELFKKYNVTHLVCRNSGGDEGYAKIVAAREMSLPVIMIDRPAL